MSDSRQTKRTRVTPYPPGIEDLMKALYTSLNEKDRRRYAAVEAAKLKYGGQTYISRLLGCDEKTIRRGLGELNDPPEMPDGRVRRKRQKKRTDRRGDSNSG